MFIGTIIIVVVLIVLYAGRKIRTITNRKNKHGSLEGTMLRADEEK